jgi:hypothetical protein
MTDKNEGRLLIDIPADGNYIEILGYKIDGFESFEAFLEHLKNYVVLEETVKAQKAEIERLTTAYPKTIASIKKIYVTAKAAAVKEFAEELIKRYSTEIDGYYGEVVWTDDIDNLVKEMVGEGNV